MSRIGRVQHAGQALAIDVEAGAVLVNDDSGAASWKLSPSMALALASMFERAAYVADAVPEVRSTCEHPTDAVSFFDLARGGELRWCLACGSLWTSNRAELAREEDDPDEWEHPAPTDWRARLHLALAPLVGMLALCTFLAGCGGGVEILTGSRDAAPLEDALADDGGRSDTGTDDSGLDAGALLCCAVGQNLIACGDVEAGWADCPAPSPTHVVACTCALGVGAEVDCGGQP